MVDLTVRLVEILLIELAAFAIAVLVRPRLLDEIAWNIEQPGRSRARYVREGADDPSSMTKAESLGERVRRWLGAALASIRAGADLVRRWRAKEPVLRAATASPDVAAANPEPALATATPWFNAFGAAGSVIPAVRSQESGAATVPANTAARRILRGDRTVLNRVVASLAGRDREQAQRWQRLLEAFFEAILEGALEAGVVYPSRAQPFWARFTPEQGRAILVALASLGFRFDGLGGWREGRTPAKHDLSIAVANAGLDPVRFHHWPAPGEMAGLVSDASIAGDEYLATVAPGLALEEVASAVGPRSASLGELWLQWGTVRPLLAEA